MPSGQFGGHPGFVLSQDLCADCSLGLNSAASLLPAPHSHPFTWGGKAVPRWSLGKALPFGRVGAERAVCAKATWGWPRDPLGWREEEARIGPVQSREPGSVGRAPEDRLRFTVGEHGPRQSHEHGERTASGGSELSVLGGT